MNPSLDSLSRPAAAATTKHHRLPAWLVPTAIATGFACLFLILFRDRLLPAKEVETATVLATTGGGEITTTQVPGTMLFQASGWIEPDPLPIKATALIDGVVDQVHLLEGAQVEKGQILATLVDADAKLALAAAEQKNASSPPSAPPTLRPFPPPASARKSPRPNASPQTPRSSRPKTAIAA